MTRALYVVLCCFGGAALAAAPAVAGHLDRQPIDWGCWAVVAMGLLAMVVGAQAALRSQ